MKRLMAKFTGKYKDLMPAGYTFHKMYARNYRTYQKSFGCNDSIWVFVKGNDIEINDFYAKTGWLVSLFIKNREVIPNILFHGSLWAVMNTETGECFRQDIPDKACEAFKEKREMYNSGDPEKVRAYFEKWKEVHIKMEMIEEILRLHDAGFIKLEGKEFPEQ